MTEEERRAIVEAGRRIYLHDGLRASFAGWSNPDYCGVHSARPGFWACPWETAKRVLESEDKRFGPLDRIWRTGYGWLGLTPGPDDFQTPGDYEHYVAAQEAGR